MLRSDLCNYSDTYIVVKGDIIVTTNNANNNAFSETSWFLKIMHH